jgi:hypothetical protein
MNLKVDQETDALYLRLDESPIIESEEVSPGVVLDYNAQKRQTLQNAVTAPIRAKTERQL